MEFRICRVNDPRVDPSMRCFDQHPLLFSNGRNVTNINNARIQNLDDHSPGSGIAQSRNGTHQVHVYRVKLPDNWICDHCLFQMRWHVVDAHQYIGS
jgi:hypothetical protein